MTAPLSFSPITDVECLDSLDLSTYKLVKDLHVLPECVDQPATHQPASFDITFVAAHSAQSTTWLLMSPCRFFPYACILASLGESISSVQNGRADASELVLCVYDTLLTFSREVDCIWRRKSSAITFLFISQRYCMIVLSILRLINPYGLDVRSLCLSCMILLWLMLFLGVSTSSF